MYKHKMIYSNKFVNLEDLIVRQRLREEKGL